MSAVMSSCGNSPGTSALTWIPYGPHSTASDSVRFFTPALAAAEWTKPGPPVHAYDAPTLMIEPGVPAAMCRRPNSRAPRNVPFSVMSITVRHALGDMSSAGTGKLAAALFTSTLGRPSSASDASNAAATWSASRMSHPTVSTRAPIASIAARPASRCSGLRLAITIAAPARANSAAIALPMPVPAPVTKTVSPSNVPAGNADAPTAGGFANPISSAISAPGEARRAFVGARGAQLRHVVAAVDERLVDHLVGHRAAQLRLRQVPDHFARHLHGYCRCRRDLLGHLPRGRVELVGRNDAAHDAVREGLLDRHHPPGEHEVAHEPGPARLEQRTHAPGVGDHAVGQLG